MNSFRNRLLVLILGLVIITQSVTLIAVLARTARSVESRGAEQLRSAGTVVQQIVRFQASQLASGVSVLATDFGFREAVASNDTATMLSAAENHATRVGADLVVLLNTRGELLAASPRQQPGSFKSLRQLIGAPDDSRDRAHFVLLGERPYQFFLAPVRAPDTIAWVAMGFEVDDQTAEKIREIVGVHVSMVAFSGGRLVSIASTLPAQQRTALAIYPAHDPKAEIQPRAIKLGPEEYLSYSRPLDADGAAIEIVLQKPMQEVLAPYYEVRQTLFFIGGIAILLAGGIGWLLGRTASRPIRELMNAARRIQGGTYDQAVEVGGGIEFRSLASTFNAMQQDIAEREARITHDAHHDSLTGLPNRTFAERHLDERIRGASSTAQIAIIGIDVRNVREINASLGHHVGDDVLRETARRLRQNLFPNDIVARVAANQFLVVSHDCSAERAPLLAEQLSGVVRSGFHLASVSLDLHVNAGVCRFPDHGKTPGELLRRVQIALEDAEDSRTRVSIYQPGRDEEHRRRLQLITDLRNAIKRDDLTLVFQPKVTMATRVVQSLEALVRWKHPTLGQISPGEFVPLAERTGSARQLTSWVLRAAARQMAQWHEEGLDVELAINLSAPDLLDPDLRDEVLDTLRAYRVDPTAVVLEITESAVMRDPSQAARNMQLLRIAGVRFSMDDFGTGYSSLSQLSRLPVDELKIDRTFIAHAHERSDDKMIVSSTVELGHSMGLKVVAEGVEKPESWNLLRELGCDFAQGYLISPPLSVTDVPPFVLQANALLPASDSTVMQIRALDQLAGRRGL